MKAFWKQDCKGRNVQARSIKRRWGDSGRILICNVGLMNRALPCECRLLEKATLLREYCTLGAQPGDGDCHI